MLSEKGLAEVAEVMSRYPTKQAAILPLFHLVQREFGFISAEAEEWIAGQLDMHPVKVHEVMTFYTMLHPKATGKFHLQVCRTLSCSLRGCDRLLAHLKIGYGLRDGGVASDGVFSLDEVECLGACGDAPVVQVNDDYHKGLTVESFEDLLQELQGRAASNQRRERG